MSQPSIKQKMCKAKGVVSYVGSFHSCGREGYARRGVNVGTACGPRFIGCRCVWQPCRHFCSYTPTLQ